MYLLNICSEYYIKSVLIPMNNWYTISTISLIVVKINSLLKMIKISRLLDEYFIILTFILKL